MAAVATLVGPLEHAEAAFAQRDFVTTLYWAAAATSDAAAAGDIVREAAAHYLMGNALEGLGKEGSALREWALGLHRLVIGGLDSHPVGAHLRMAIGAHGRHPRAFLSYSSSEARLARRMADWLRDSEIQPIEYERDFVAGSEINGEIQRALEHASLVLVLWSHRYLTRPYCIAELESALGRIREWQRVGPAPRLIIVRTDATEVPEFGGHIHIDARSGFNRRVKGQLLQSLLRG
jgi:hypothetical protein